MAAPELKRSIIGKRKTVSLSPEQLVDLQRDTFPAVITPKVEGLNLASWVENNREFLESHLLTYGAILFRDFSGKGLETFEQFLSKLSDDLMTYSFGSTPRHEIKDKIYTSTEYPPEQAIPLHNEMSYSRSWPMKIAFSCLQKATQGGETPIADSRKVFARIHPKLKDKFVEKGVMYVRNYGSNLDLSWQRVFKTNEKEEVENYCKKNQIMFKWKQDNKLKTIQICQGAFKHPKTLEMVWFNQAHLFHISNLEKTDRQELLASFKLEDLPRNAYYGDGSIIEDSLLEEIRHIYQQETVIFPWQEGDILLLDNMLVAHGRMPFCGSRKVIVGMSDLFNNHSF